MRESPAVPYALSLLAGLALWGATAAAEQKAEPWDAELFWTLSYPLSVLFAGLFGYAFPHRPWRWALVITFSQLLVMLPGASGIGLLPLGLFFLAILSLPAVGLALIAGWLGRRRTSG